MLGNNRYIFNLILCHTLRVGKLANLSYYNLRPSNLDTLKLRKKSIKRKNQLRLPKIEWVYRVDHLADWNECMPFWSVFCSWTGFFTAMRFNLLPSVNRRQAPCLSLNWKTLEITDLIWVTFVKEEASYRLKVTVP